MRRKTVDFSCAEAWEFEEQRIGLRLTAGLGESGFMGSCSGCHTATIESKTPADLASELLRKV
jgi:hypothetical protein